MRVKQKVIDQYKALCKHSAAKCSNDSEIVGKVHRSITLGQVTAIKNGGDMLVVRYYDLDFTINKNVIVNVWRNRKVAPVLIDEEVKNQYNESIQYIVNNNWQFTN